MQRVVILSRESLLKNLRMFYDKQSVMDIHTIMSCYESKQENLYVGICHLYKNVSVTNIEAITSPSWITYGEGYYCEMKIADEHKPLVEKHYKLIKLIKVQPNDRDKVYRDKYYKQWFSKTPKWTFPTGLQLSHFTYPI